MIVYRTILFYCALILVIRLMGKRQVGQMEPSEFVVTMLLANLASIPMEDLERPVWHGLAAMGLVLLAERMVSRVCLKNIRLRRILCGKPVILIDNGKLLQDNLRRTRISMDELTSHLRQKDVLTISDVQYAILETDGNLSVFPYASKQPAPAEEAKVRVKRRSLPVTIINDGRLSREDLSRAGKDMIWLRNILSQHRARTETTLLLTVDGEDTVVWIGKSAH